MSNFFITLIVAFILIVLAIALMAIGWLITGKSKIVRGACGMNPEELRKKECGTEQIKCGICDPKHEKDKKTKESEEDHSKK